MPRLNKEQRRERDFLRFKERVEQRRSEGKDVVAYALANSKATKHLTDDEKTELKKRKADLKAREKANVDLAIEIAEIMLRAVKDNLDPDGPEARKAIREAKIKFRKGELN